MLITFNYLNGNANTDDYDDVDHDDDYNENIHFMILAFGNCV